MNETITTVISEPEKPNYCNLLNSWLIISKAFAKSVYTISVWVWHSKDCIIIFLAKARLLNVERLGIKPNWLLLRNEEQ